MEPSQDGHLVSEVSLASWLRSRGGGQNWPVALAVAQLKMSMTW